MAEEKPTEKNKPIEYRSFEQKYLVDSGIKDFLAYFGKAFYGTVISMYRFPTFMRKLINKQTFFQREKILNLSPFANSKGSGMTWGWGCSFGIIAGSGLFAYSAGASGASGGNYTPLAVLGLTNLVSLSFELGRFSKSKQEHLAMKTKENKKKQENLEAKISEGGGGGNGGGN